MTISGIADIPGWNNRYNFRSTLPIYLDLTTQTTVDDVTQITYEKNLYYNWNKA